MPTACVNQPGCRIGLRSERLEVSGPRPDTGAHGVLREIPLRDLERLLVQETVQITSAALGELMRRAIPVALLSGAGRYLGGFLPAANTHARVRLRQYACGLDAAARLALARPLVTAKLYNQRRVLQRLAANRGREAEFAADLAWLGSLLALAGRAAAGADELRGYEGAGTARYFAAWARFLPGAFPFERRSTRPPHNAVNACLSFGATLLYQETAAVLHAHGLDPALGLLHATEDGRWSLALDLMEPFRPVLVEALALDGFSHGILGDGHFEPRADGGVYLNAAGRGKFLFQYERRMERTFLGEQAGHRTSLRAQVEAGVTRLKAALLRERPSPPPPPAGDEANAAPVAAPGPESEFEGFLMN